LECDLPLKTLSQISHLWSNQKKGIINSIE